MAKNILTALLGGLLVLGVSTAFAEEPQGLEQDVIQAQLKAPTVVTQLSGSTPLERTSGPQLLSDEELEQIGAGFGVDLGKAGVIIGLGLLKTKAIVGKVFNGNMTMTSQ